MVVLRTPHGEFETTLFAIAEKIPNRLSELCEKNPPAASNTLEGFPYVCDLRLGDMDKLERHALNLILNVAAGRRRGASRNSIIFDIDGKSDIARNLDMQVFMENVSFSRNDAADMKEAIVHLRDDLLNIKNYKQISLSHYGEVKKYLERKFSPTDEKDYPNVLELLLKAYGQISGIINNSTEKNGDELFLMEKSAFLKMAKEESTAFGRGKPISTTRLFE